MKINVFFWKFDELICKFGLICKFRIFFKIYVFKVEKLFINVYSFDFNSFKLWIEFI